MGEEDPEEEPIEDEKLEEEPLEAEDPKEEQLIREDLEENPVEKELKLEVTRWKWGRYSRMCHGTCLIDAPTQQMLVDAESLFLKTVMFIFPFACECTLRSFIKVLM